MLIYYCYHPSEGSLRTASEFVGMDQPSARAKVEADLNATTLEMNRAIRDVERRPGLALNLQLAQHWHREAVMQMCRYCSHYGVSYFHRVSSDTVWTDTEPRPKLTLQEARTVLSRLHTERFTEQHWGGVCELRTGSICRHRQHIGMDALGSEVFTVWGGGV